MFWTLFFIVIISLFFLNLELIRSNVRNTGFLDRLFNRNEVAETRDPLPPEPPPRAPLPAEPPEEAPPPPPFEEPLPDTGPADLPAGIEGNSPPASPAPAAPPATPSSVADRALYFIRVDDDGAILRIRVARSMPASSSPLADTIGLLLRGPTADERNRGLISLIPPGTSLLRARIRGSTAYLSFSEDFQFNTYGVEGYIGQLRQIIWTATEFPNIKDVQILIEDRRVDYLGEGIGIGSPLNRNSF